jgi:DNA polymerase III subunit gamma/tau
VLERVKTDGTRVAAIVIGNASPVSLDEAVLTLRFPRQGDVKGFVNSRYEDLLKQVINSMFGINVVVRAVTGGDTPPPGGRQGPAVPPASPPPAPAPQEPSAPRSTPPEPVGSSVTYPPSPSASDQGAAGGADSANGPFGKTAVQAGDLPPLPPPPAPDDEEDFDLDDEEMSDSMAHELSGMALVKRELGGEVIAEYTE